MWDSSVHSSLQEALRDRLPRARRYSRHRTQRWIEPISAPGSKRPNKRDRSMYKKSQRLSKHYSQDMNRNVKKHRAGNNSLSPGERMSPQAS